MALAKSPPPLDVDSYRREALVVRSIAGGMLMGLANLVPGISGGTMLLAVGVYPQFIAGVAEVSTFRFRPRVLLLLAGVGGTAAVTIVGFAGLIAGALDHYRWAMYSLFIGLTLGGVPLIWRRLHPVGPTALVSAGVAAAAMVVLASIEPERLGQRAEPGFASYAMLVLAGSSGGAAMILPGVSGAYLLLVLGQYRVIVEAVAFAAAQVRGGAWGLAAESLSVLVPVGLGVVVGVVGVSNLMRTLLARYPRATLGCLLGLLGGAVVGLWPFTTPIMPAVGDIVRGVELTTPEMVDAVEARHYRRGLVVPSAGQAGMGALLVATGFGVSWGIARFGD